MIELIQSYLDGETKDFYALVGKLEGALDASEIKDDALINKWYDVWMPLEIRRATEGNNVNLEAVIKELKIMEEFLLNNTEIIEIINFNDLPVFEGTTAYPLIYFALKKNRDDYQFNYYSLNELPTFSLKEKLSNVELLSTSKSIFTHNDFKFVDNRISNIIEKVKIGTVPIKDFCGLPIVGVKTGFNEGFLTDLKNDKIVKPYVFVL